MLEAAMTASPTLSRRMTDGPLDDAQRLRGLFALRAELIRSQPMRIQELDSAIREMKEFKTTVLPATGETVSVDTANEFLNELLKLREDVAAAFPPYFRSVENRIDALLPENLRFSKEPATAAVSATDDDEHQAARDAVGATADGLAVASGLAALLGAVPVAAFLGGAAMGMYFSLVLDSFQTADGT
jgi:hypothetical protein